MSVLPIVYYPDKRLRKRSAEVTKKTIVSDEFQALLGAMVKTMHAHKGIGLAGVQVGELSRVTVVDTKDGILPLINPVITKRSWKKNVDEEGCLSIPAVFGPVKRNEVIKVTALDKNGEPIMFEAKGLFARVIQHEIDHMDGVLFIDHSKKLTADGKKISLDEIDEFVAQQIS